MARRRRAREEAHADRWVVSYADFITLLLAFFVVMYSISSVNEGKYKVLSDSLQGIFLGSEGTLAPIDLGELRQESAGGEISLLEPRAAFDREPPLALDPEALELLRIQADAEQQFEALIADGRLSVSANRLWVEIEIASALLFASGSATPGMDADPVLEAVAEIVKPYPNPLHVEGFTDDEPINTRAFPSNWELSAARAAGVVRMLAHFGVAPERMAAVGYGEYQPKVSNRTPKGRAKNRRVKIIISRDERVRRALNSFGSGSISEDTVRTILQYKAEPDPASSAAPIQQVETEQGVLFTRDPQPSSAAQ